MSGYIKLYRKFLNWEWYSCGTASRVFLHLLLSANYTDSRFQGTLVRRGQTLFKRSSLSRALNLSEQQVRHAITQLKSTGEITVKTTNKFSVATLMNYEFYQGDPSEITSKTTNNPTNEQPTNNQQTTNKIREMNITSESPKPKEVKKLRRKRSEEISVLIPKNLDTEPFKSAWRKWIEYRIQMKKPLTALGKDGLLNRLSKIGETRAINAIEYSISQSWQGVYEEKKPQTQEPKRSFIEVLNQVFPDDAGNQEEKS